MEPSSFYSAHDKYLDNAKDRAAEAVMKLKRPNVYAHKRMSLSLV